MLDRMSLHVREQQPSLRPLQSPTRAPDDCQERRALALLSEDQAGPACIQNQDERTAAPDDVAESSLNRQERVFSIMSPRLKLSIALGKATLIHRIGQFFTPEKLSLPIQRQQGHKKI